MGRRKSHGYQSSSAFCIFQNQCAIVHLHNLHGHNVHLGILFSYLKEKHLKIFWTFHDCWAFTGYCPHFDMIGCDKWKTECHSCPQLSVYPKSRFDNTKLAYRLKKKWFLAVAILSLFARETIIFLSAPASFIQYSYPMMFVTLFSTFVVLCEWREQKYMD